MGCMLASSDSAGKLSMQSRILPPAAGCRSQLPMSEAVMSTSWSIHSPRSSILKSSSGDSRPMNWRSGCWYGHSCSSKHLQNSSVVSAMPDQPRLRQISCSARAMRPALADTYIKSAMREKESSLGLLTNACSRMLIFPVLFSMPPLISYGQQERASASSSGISSSRTATFSNSAHCDSMYSTSASLMCRFRLLLNTSMVVCLM
mmetsp:Transcript_32333/g.83761  ORF Transcript_32333/g.83761 Transcript_32333/m.83761 type:complete len:204 (-) Transcript_32333:617-1228(-)